MMLIILYHVLRISCSERFFKGTHTCTCRRPTTKCQSGIHVDLCVIMVGLTIMNI